MVPWGRRAGSETAADAEADGADGLGPAEAPGVADTVAPPPAQPATSATTKTINVSP